MHACVGWCLAWLCDELHALPCTRAVIGVSCAKWGREAMEVPTCRFACMGLPLHLYGNGMKSVDGSKAQPAGQPNPVEGSLEFGLLVFDPDTIIAFGNPTNDLMPVRLFPGLRCLRCMQRRAGSGRGGIRLRPVCDRPTRQGAGNGSGAA